MNPISDSKLLHHLPRVAGDFRPITADVFLTNYCNNACPYCTYKRWELDDGAAYLGIDDFKRYAKRLVALGVKGIILTGGGEPLINKDFEKITKYLDEKDISYGINTNLNVLRLCRPDYLKVSLDAYDEASYERRRGVRAYEQVKKNIRTFAEWKAFCGGKTNLGIQMVVSDPAEIPMFYEANHDLPVDYIVFRPVESTSGSYYSTEEKLAEAEKAIQAVKALQEKDRRVVLNYKWNMLQMGFSECVAHWAQIALNEKGQVIYCCHKPYEIIGHIMDSDILERYAAARTDTTMCDVPCRLTAPNAFMERVKAPASNPAFI